MGLFLVHFLGYSLRENVVDLYSRSLSTGKQGRTKAKDYVRDVEFIYKEASDGKPLYIGWLAITDFSGVSSLYVGGIMASLMPKNIVEATGIDRSHILTGLFTDTSVVGDNNDINVDQLPLDYDILEDVNYKYPAGDNYFAYTTRGCPNHCSFCAVPILEPSFHVTNNIVEQIRATMII